MWSATKDLRGATSYIDEKCKDEVAFVAFVKFGNGLRVRNSMPENGLQFENIESPSGDWYTMVIGLEQSDAPRQSINTLASRSSVTNVAIGMYCLDLR